MLHAGNALSEGHDVTLIGPRGCGRYFSKAKKVIECPSAPGPFLMAASVKGIAHCITQRYQYVVGGSGLVAPVVVLLAKISRAAPTVHVHGLDLVVRHSIYQALFVKMIRRCTIIIANSANTRDIAISKGCSSQRLRVVNPGTRVPSTSELAPTDGMYESLGIDRETPVALFVGRAVKRKGLIPFLEHAWPQMLDSIEGVRLLVVGDHPQDAIARSPDQATQIRRVLHDKQITDTVMFLGSVADDLLWRYYALARVLVFPLIQVEGDVEGFGMVALEAAACGTPTVAFDVGGVGDAVVEGKNGVLIPAGDYAAFAAATVNVIQQQQPTAVECRAHAETLSWANHAKKLAAALTA